MIVRSSKCLGMVELNVSCLVFIFVVLVVLIEVIEECCGYLGWFGRGFRLEGIDEIVLGVDERGF